MQKCTGFVIICTVILFLSCHSGSTLVDNSRNQVSEFPYSWSGQYIGYLKLFNEWEIDNQVKMELTIGREESEEYIPWIIKYNDEDIRNYGLRVKNANTGHYIIDEFNGIQLDAYLNGNTLVAQFEILNNEITMMYTHEGKYIDINIISSDRASQTYSGNVVSGNDTIPEVKSLPVVSYHKGRLFKIRQS